MQKKFLLGVIIFSAYEFHASQSRQFSVKKVTGVTNDSFRQLDTPPIAPCQKKEDISPTSNDEYPSPERAISLSRSLLSTSAARSSQNQSSLNFSPCQTEQIDTSTQSDICIQIFASRDNFLVDYSENDGRPNTAVTQAKQNTPVKQAKQPVTLDLQKLMALKEQYSNMPFSESTDLIELNLDVLLLTGKHLIDMSDRELKMLLNNPLSTQTRQILAYIISENDKKESLEKIYDFLRR